MVAADVTWETLSLETLPFARTPENWHSVVNPATNERFFQRLLSPDYYESGRVPDHLLIAPAAVKIRLTVRASSPPRAYFTMGGRGTFMLPLTDTGRTIPVMGVLEDGRSTAPQGLRVYEAEYTVPLSVPNVPREPFWGTIFVVTEDGEVFSERREFSVLEQRLTPSLDRAEAAKFVGSIVHDFFERHGIDQGVRLAESLGVEAAEDFKGWFMAKGHVASLLVGGLEPDSLLDELILADQMFATRNYSSVELIHHVIDRARKAWLPALVDRFIQETRPALAPAAQEPPAGGTAQLLAGIPEGIRDLVDPRSRILKALDEGGQYGDYYYMVIPPAGDIFIIAEDRTVYTVFGFEDVPEVVPTEEGARTALRAEWEKFREDWDIAIATVRTIANYALGRDSPSLPERLGGVVRDVIDYAFGLDNAYLMWVPVFPEVRQLGLKLPEIARPALSMPGTFSTYDTRIIADILRDTVFQYWSPQIYERFGAVRTPEEHSEMRAEAIQVMEWWSQLNTAFKDARQVLLQTMEDLRERNLPEVVHAYKVMHENSRDGVSYERLPYGKFWWLPPAWWPSRVIRYLDLHATYRDIVATSAREIGTGITGPYWPSIVPLEGGAIDALETTRYLADLRRRLTEGTVPEHELAEAEILARSIVESSEIARRFKELHTAATHVLHTLDPGVPAGPGVHAALLAPIELALLSFPIEEIPHEALQKLAPETAADRRLLETVVLKRHRELEAEFEELQEGTFTPADRDAFLARIEQARVELGQYVLDNVTSAYRVDFDILWELIAGLDRDFRFGKLLTDMAAQPRDPQIQELVNRTILDPGKTIGFQHVVMNRFLEVTRTDILNQYSTAIFSSRDELAEALVRDLTKAWDSVTRQVVGELDLGPDWADVLHHINLYVGGGYLTFHHGQRVVTRTLAGIAR